MSTQPGDDDDSPNKKPFHEQEWYDTLRTILEPYMPATGEQDAEERFSSAELISSIEQHHGVPQGLVGKDIRELFEKGDFVTAMHRLGFRETNAGGVQLQWLMKKKTKQ
jgi:hypothetical protein